MFVVRFVVVVVCESWPIFIFFSALVNFLFRPMRNLLRKCADTVFIRNPHCPNAHRQGSFDDRCCGSDSFIGILEYHIYTISNTSLPGCVIFVCALTINLVAGITLVVTRWRAAVVATIVHGSLLVATLHAVGCRSVVAGRAVVVSRSSSSHPSILISLATCYYFQISIRALYHSYSWVCKYLS